MVKQSIWKFVLPLNDRVIVEMPKGAQILTLGVQQDAICAWALVEVNATRVQRVFDIRGTGHPADAIIAKRYVGTIQMGPFVWHVFDGGESSAW